ncbi:hypothetical protein GCM10009812_04890 [Nocardioides marinus]
MYVFIDGCFWHGCPDHFVPPKTRADFWHEKIRGNWARDRSTDAALRSMHLTSLRIWEHTPPDQGADLIVQTYRGLLG